ncbi:MAG TPA: ribosome maturation factor RimM [Rhizomicrobium sp.]|nr:ribosome maturation factor RimM [Rhizomicrobium sp.]
MSRDILLGVVMGAQGLKGEVKVKTFTESPESLGAYGALHAKDGREFVVRAARNAKADIAVVRFDGVNDRNAAETLKGLELFVARDALPPPEDEEFYHADLVGLAAHDAEGRVLGTISAIHNFGAGDVVAIRRADGGDMFLPFTRAVVPTIDLSHGFVVVAVPEDADDDEDWKAGP